MTDSDIQYIGNWSSDQIVPNPSAYISALILTSQDDSKLRLTLPKSQSLVVLIGRAPRNEFKEDEGKATYSNVLMSRRHAKITFSESAIYHDSISLTDTHSHHGTWVNRKAEDYKLTPDKPFRLEDGDKITFGKAVTKDGVSHTPLTVSVKILFNSSRAPSEMPKSCSVTPDSSRARSNRFGLSLSSSESESSSDVEESPAREVETSRVGTTSSLFGLTSPQSSPDPLSRPPVRDLLPPMDPGVQDDEDSVQANHGEPVPNSSLANEATPPWRRFSHAPWFDVTTSILRHVPDILPRPSLRTDYLFGSKSFSRWNTTNQQNSSPFHHVHADPHTHGHGREHNVPPLLHGHHHHHHHPPSNGHDDHDDHDDHQHDHHHHHNNVSSTGSSDKTLKDLGDDINVLKEGLLSLKTTVSRLDETSATNDHVQSLLDNLEKRVLEKSAEGVDGQIDERIATVRSPLETSLEQIRARLSRCQTHIVTSGSSLRNDIMRLYDERIDKIDRLCLDAARESKESRDEIAGCKTEANVIKMDIETLRDDLKSLNETVSKGRDHNEVIVSDSDEGTTSALESRLKEYVNAELESRLVNIDARSDPVLGKRKRPDGEDQDYADVHVQTIEDTVVMPSTVVIAPEFVSRPAKRLRTLRNCIVPGVIGALGAWVGLAYL